MYIHPVGLVFLHSCPDPDSIGNEVWRMWMFFCSLAGNLRYLLHHCLSHYYDCSFSSTFRTIFMYSLATLVSIDLCYYWSTFLWRHPISITVLWCICLCRIIILNLNHMLKHTPIININISHRTIPGSFKFIRIMHLHGLL